MRAVPFLKMHGIGNDFIVLDARLGDLGIDAGIAQAISDRYTGIGCDQVVLLEPPWRPGADMRVRFLNADGSEAGACGNGTRCAAALLMEELRRNEVVIETLSGLLPVTASLDGKLTVDMGPPRLDWQEVPLAEAADTLNVATGIDGLDAACCCSMGNPHATFFVADADAVGLAALGPVLENHPLFPERANIGFASLIAPDRLRLRVWERGAGPTLACGSGACATVVAAARRGVTGRSAELVMERGSLFVTWREDDHVLLTGPAAVSFSGTFELLD